MEYAHLKCRELKEELKSRGLKVSGTKTDMLKRLMDDDAMKKMADENGNESDYSSSDEFGTDYSKMKYSKLKKNLRHRGLDSVGKKVDLIKRLEEDDAKYKPANENELILNVKTMMGMWYTIRIGKHASLLDLKKAIMNKSFAEINRQTLYHLREDGVVEMGDRVYPDGKIGKLLKDDDKSLDDLGIWNNSFFDLYVRLF